jgi:hypothetical protein
MRTRLRQVATVGLAFALTLHSASRARAGETEVEGPRSRIVSTVKTPGVAEACRDAIEAAIDLYEKRLPYRLPSGQRLVFRLYSEVAEYEDAVKAAGAPQFARNRACTLNEPVETFLVLNPRDDPEYLATIGHLPERTRFLVCHEGVHQFLHRAGAAHDDFWPDWYAEGMCEHIAGECLALQKGPKASTLLPVEDARHRVRDALERRRMLSLERLLYAEATSFEAMPVLYAHAHEIYRLLAADPVRLGKLHAAIGALEAPAGATRDARMLAHAHRCREALEAAYGPLDALEAAWVRQTQSTSASWFEAGRACERVGEEWICAGLPGQNAAVLSAAPPKSPFALRFELNVHPSGDRQADLVLGYEQREDPRFVKIALGSAGFVTLLTFSDGRWQERFRVNRSVPPTTFAAGTWVPVTVAVDRTTLRLSVRDRVVLETRVPPGFSLLSGWWGLGSTNGVVRFRNVEAAPAK